MIVQSIMWYQYHRPRPWVLLLSSSLFIQSHAFAVLPQEESATTELRARLTEREQENRVKQPWTTQFLGHPLSATLQYELAYDWTRPSTRDNAAYRETRVIIEQHAEPEFFYTLGPQLSFLAQARVVREKATHVASRDFVERGEIWLYTQPMLSFPVTFEIGRLDFEDDRRWWWDEDLDALRVTLATRSFELMVAFAQERYPVRSDRDFIDPEHEALRRWFVETSWDLQADQSIQLFALLHDDHSPTPGIGEIVAKEREDASDANLNWLGLRATGARAWAPVGSLGYWIDTAWVSGNERALGFAPLSGTQSVVNEQVQRHIRGWAFDVGATWLASIGNDRQASPRIGEVERCREQAPGWRKYWNCRSNFQFDPRFTLGYARGSGDPSPGDERDRAFRQTGLHSNAPGFGGVQSFRGYGVLLDPELSNLAIVTAGAGISLFEASSLDVVYHHYRQVQPADTLRGARLNTALNGMDRDLGHGLDLVVVVKEWERLHFEISASALRAGAAFGAQRGQWTFGAFTKLQFAF